MKVILTQDVKGLGKKGDMVEASDGHARNYLIPKGFATLATNTNINIMNSRKEAEKHKKEKEMERARALAKSIDGRTVILKAKAGENGKLFGSITSKDIADAMKSQLQVDIDKKKLVIPDAIKSIGSITADVKVYPEISAKITVKIEQE